MHNSFTGFFSRLKSNKTAGFPRFRSFNTWKSFSFIETNGIRITGNRIKFKGLNIRFHKHRELPPDIKSVIFKKELTGWYVCIQVAQDIQPKQKTNKSIGIDLGLKNLATTSKSEFIKNIRPYKALEDKIKKKQQEFSACKKGTIRRKKTNLELARLHLKIRNRRATYLHQISARLIREYDDISIEKLDIEKLIGLDYAKSIYDAGWGILIHNLRYKAESAGVSLREVNPAYTSQICNSCGVIKKLSLSDRVYACDDCGFIIDRDVNAALNIMDKGCSESYNKDQMKEISN